MPAMIPMPSDGRTIPPAQPGDTRAEEVADAAGQEQEARPTTLPTQNPPTPLFYTPPHQCTYTHNQPAVPGDSAGGFMHPGGSAHAHTYTHATPGPG